MRQIDAMTFRGALKILGKHDHPTLDKINAALGGAILLSGASCCPDRPLRRPL